MHGLFWRAWRFERGLARAAVAAAAAAAAAGVIAPTAHALAAPQIYWPNSISGNIGAANLDGTAINPSFITGTASSSPSGVAVDGQRIYWVDDAGGTIGVANLDGTAVNRSFITGASEPEAVAVNGQHIYWANYISGTIGEANLDGTAVNQSFITGASNPVGVAVDGQHIYWANDGSGTIGEANLDGTAVNQSFITGASNPVGVAVDGQHIYWANAISSTIGVANLDGTAVNQRFITGVDPSDGMAVDSQRIYWANIGTIGVANVDGTAVNKSLVSSGASFGVAVSVPVTQINPASPPAFQTTPQGTLSAPLTLTVSNAGRRALSLSGLSFTAADPGDFVVSSNGCLGSVAPGESCQLTVSFAPQAQGARSATLQIASNDYANSPLTVALSGTGGSLPQGPPGTQGATGKTGRKGQPGKVELITCKTITTTVKGKPRKVQRCTGRLVSGKVKFATSAADSASIARGRVVYASGVRVALGDGRSELLLNDLRVIHAGRYTLTVRSRHHRRWSTRSVTITIG